MPGAASRPPASGVADPRWMWVRLWSLRQSWEHDERCDVALASHHADHLPAIRGWLPSAHRIGSGAGSRQKLTHP
eukprot:1911276-Prymnesium_polylepis.2